MSNANKPRTAYYLRRYPVLSETFIRREIEAIREGGIAIDIIADQPEDKPLELFGLRTNIETTTYIEPVDRRRLKSYLSSLLLTRPWRVLAVSAYILTQRYSRFKSPSEDRQIFVKSVLLAGILLERKIRHLHTPWMSIDAFVAICAAKLAGITFTTQARAFDIHSKPYVFALQQKLRQARLVITNTRYNYAHLKAMLPARQSEKIHQIYNGVPLGQMQPEKNGHRNSPLPVILSVGRLVEQKGLTYLLKACRYLMDREVQFVCEIVGAPHRPGSDHHKMLLRLHRDLDLNERVRFLGPKSFAEILERYKTAAIFVLPCVIQKDGGRDIIPNALIEAMAMQLPVISTFITGIPEIVDPGVDGILVPPRDESALAEAIMNLLADEERMRFLGQNARRKVEARFDITKNIKQYVLLFRQASECRTAARNRRSGDVFIPTNGSHEIRDLANHGPRLNFNLGAADE